MRTEARGTVDGSFTRGGLTGIQRVGIEAEIKGANKEKDVPGDEEGKLDNIVSPTTAPQSCCGSGESAFGRCRWSHTYHAAVEPFSSQDPVGCRSSVNNGFNPDNVIPRRLSWRLQAICRMVFDLRVSYVLLIMQFLWRLILFLRVLRTTCAMACNVLTDVSLPFRFKAWMTEPAGDPAPQAAGHHHLWKFRHGQSWVAGMNRLS